MNSRRDPLACDILVIGAGPAGSSAAAFAAMKGLDVLVVEQRSKIGVPVRCAEYIPAPLVGQLKLGNRFIVQKISRMTTILPDGLTTDMAAPGFTIHRDRFDSALAEEASKRGARFLLSSRAVEKTEGGHVIIRKRSGESLCTVPRVIIGADGPRSQTARWCGVSNFEPVHAVQYRIALKNPMAHTEVHFSPDFHGGYGWLFPKGETANLGLGIRNPGHSVKGIRNLLNDFMEKLKKDDKIQGEPLSATGGLIPARPLKRAVYGNILLCGDAAAQTHPITGAGIFSAVSCGQMAGSWAAEAVKKGDLSILSEYDREWRDLFGETLDRAHERRRYMEREWESFENIIRFCWIGFRDYYREHSPLDH